MAGRGNSPKQNENPKIEIFKTIVELVKASFWPVLVMAIFLQFYAELKQVVQLIPASIARATKIEVGSLKFEIQVQANATGNPELANALGQLSEKEIAMLLTLPRQKYEFLGRLTNLDESQSYSIPSKPKLETLLKLEKGGYVRFDYPLENFLNLVSGISTRSRPSEFRKETLLDEDFDVSRNLDEERKRRLDSYSFNLSDKGIGAFNAIVAAISKQLKTP